MPAIPMPDQGSQDYLDEARKQVTDQLRGTMPDSMLAPVSAPSRVSISQTQQQPVSDQDLQALSQPGVSAAGEEPVFTAPRTTQTAQEEPIAPPSFGSAVKEEAGRTAAEIGKAWMRGSLSLANALGFGVASLARAGAYVAGQGSQGADTASDAVFDFLRNHVDTARANWQQANDLAPIQKVVGGVTEAATPLLLGPAAGVEAFAASSASDAAKESIDRGEDKNTAATLALIHGISSELIGRLPLKSPNLLRRALTSIGIGVPISSGTDKLTKEILNNKGYKEAAAQIDPLNPTQLGIDTLMQAIFAAMGGPKGTAKKAEPPPDLTAKGEQPIPPGPAPGAGEPPAPPAKPSATPTSTVPRGWEVNVNANSASAAKDAELRAAESTPVSTASNVPDHPSAEPVKDLQAQVEALGKGQRKGVYLSKANVDALGPDGVKALVGDKPASMNFDGKGGVMIFDAPGTRMKAGKAKKAEGADLQKIIGELTGAGEGKKPEQTAVVQGQTPEGAVASESAVTPAEVPAKVEEVKAAGHEPVVTTPEAAVARREEEIAKEPAVSPEPVKPVEPVSPQAVSSEPTPSTPPAEGRAGAEASTLSGEASEPSAAAPGEPKVSRSADFKTTGNYDVEHNGTVRKIYRNPENGWWYEDKAGHHSRNVLGFTKKEAIDAIVGGKEAIAPRTTEPKASSQESATSEFGAVQQSHEQVQTKGEVIPDLERAAANLRTSEASVKKRGGLRDRIANVSAFARVLHAAANHAAENNLADEAGIQRATEAATAAEKLDQKSEEEIGKGKGIGHAELAAHAKELLAASEQLQGRPAEAKDEVGVKAKKLATRISKAKERVAQERATTPEAPADTGETVKVRGEDRKLADVVADGLKQGVKPVFTDIGSRLEVDVADRKRVADAMKAAKEAAGKKEAKTEKIKSAIEDVPDEVKVAKKKAEEEGPLRQLNKGEKFKVDAALERYKISGHDAAGVHRDSLEKLLNDLYQPSTVKEHEAVQMVMHSADNMRGDWHGEAPRDLGGPDEQKVESIDYSDPNWGEHVRAADGKAEYDDQTLQAAASKHWVNLHKETSALWEQLLRHRDTGVKLSTHKVLDYILSRAEAGSPLHDLISKVREHVPDLAIQPVSAIRNPNGEVATAVGRFTQGKGVELLVKDDIKKRADAFVTMIHELVHGATVDFMRNNPDHPLTAEIGRLRDLAEQRMRRQYGDAIIDRALSVWRGKSQMPPHGSKEREDIIPFYGLKDPYEFITVSMTNPAFKRRLVESEAHAGDSERLPAASSILGRVFKAVAKMLGIKRPDSARLLAATMHISSRIMEAQSKMDAGQHVDIPADAYESVEDRVGDIVEHLSEDDGLINEPRILEAAGARATKIARDFVNTVKTGSLGKLQAAVNGLKTFDQLIRDGTHWFGARDDTNNPLRQLHDATSAGMSRTNEILEKALPLVERSSRLSTADTKQLGQLMADTTRWGIDPSLPDTAQSAVSKKDRKFVQRYADFKARWDNLSPEQRDLYTGIRDLTKWATKRNRAAGIDAALRTFSDTEIPAPVRELLYNVKSAGEFDSLVGIGKAVDVGDRNEPLLKSLYTLAGLSETAGPYFHLGRNGNYVVEVNPEGTKKFNTKEEAEAFAAKIGDLSPESEGIVSENPDGTHSVDYTAHYVSMHENAKQAEADAEQMRAAGFDVGNVTKKVLGKQSAPLSAGMEQIVAEASRKLNRQMGDDAEPLVTALRTSFVQMLAARSAYAGSKLMRNNVGGVKGEEMLRNFASHIQSLAWHTGQLSSVFQKGEALGKVRQAAKDSSTGDQRSAYMRGEILEELNKRLQQETSQYGVRSPFNAAVAKLGFMNYLASPAHAMIWMTQNFTTTAPVAGARWGYRRAAGSLSSAMMLVTGPAFRKTFMAHLRPDIHGSSEIMQAVIAAVKKDPRFGKWAQGENSHLRKLMDRGAISASFSNELGLAAQGGNRKIQRVMDYARILPHFADVFNRVSTGLAALELTGGDVYKAADFIRETHMDYASSNKPRAFKAVNRIPGFNSVTMFRTYTQGMAHLIYSNIKHMSTIDLPEGAKSRAEAAKTVAGVMLGTSILAGVTKGMVLEPVRLAIYAWNKLFGDDDEFHDIDHAIDKFMEDHLGQTVGEMVSRGVPRGLGFDLSGRMGLGDLFFYDMPDLFSGDPDKWTEFTASALGPMPEYVARQSTAMTKHLQDGEYWNAIADIVPLKLLQDSMKAGALMTEGKINDRGARIVDTNVGAGLSRFIGFQSAAEARASEKQRVSFEYHDQLTRRRTEIMRQWMKGGYASVASKISEFNRKNPAHMITVKDYVRMRKGDQLTEGEVNGVPGRDPKLNDILSY